MRKGSDTFRNKMTKGGGKIEAYKIMHSYISFFSFSYIRTQGHPLKLIGNRILTKGSGLGTITKMASANHKISGIKVIYKSNFSRDVFNPNS